VELHVHTTFSDDAVNTFEDLETAAVEHGTHLFAITDHDTIEGALRLRDRGRVGVIVGEEVTTALGDVIGLFLAERIPPGLAPEETMDRIHAQGGLVYVPHPFDRKRRTRLFRVAIERCTGRTDLFEVVNGRTPHVEDEERAAAHAAAHGLVPACGADAHEPGELGAIFHDLPPFETAADFLRSMRAGRPAYPAPARGRGFLGRIFGSHRRGR
jgi:predicted metal-dependent phosphoesterase TrpH